MVLYKLARNLNYPSKSTIVSIVKEIPDSKQLTCKPVLRTLKFHKFGLPTKKKVTVNISPLVSFLSFSFNSCRRK
jgi:hypothetical protein